MGARKTSRFIVWTFWTGNWFLYVYAIDSWNEFVELVRILLKSRNIVVTNHEDFKAAARPAP